MYAYVLSIARLLIEPNYIPLPCEPFLSIGVAMWAGPQPTTKKCEIDSLI